MKNSTKKIPFCCGKIPCIKWKKNVCSPCYELNKNNNKIRKLFGNEKTLKK